MKIFVAADHRGYNLHRQLIDYLKRCGYNVVDEGDQILDPADDFPFFVHKAINALKGSNDTSDRAILLCGSGQGACMAANRFTGIRAALGYDVATAKSSRNDDDSNVLCLPADRLGLEQAQTITEEWLSTPFSGTQRYMRRIKEMDEL